MSLQIIGIMLIFYKTKYWSVMLALYTTTLYNSSIDTLVVDLGSHPYATPNVINWGPMWDPFLTDIKEGMCSRILFVLNQNLFLHMSTICFDNWVWFNLLAGLYNRHPARNVKVWFTFCYLKQSSFSQSVLYFVPPIAVSRNLGPTMLEIKSPFGFFKKEIYVYRHMPFHR